MIELKRNLRKVKHEIERIFSVRPMQKVLCNLESRGYDTKSMDELELFGGVGDIHLVDIYRKVKTVKVWEYDQDCVSILKDRFNNAEIFCKDTYAAIKEEKNQYDLIVSDNPIQTETGHIEHFDLFPDILYLLKNKSVLIISIIPNPTEEYIAHYPKLLDSRHQNARKDFYQCKDPKNITHYELEKAFEKQLSMVNITMPWSFIQKRNNLLSYFVCGIDKIPGDS